MKARSQSNRRQRGFTLVEMSVTMAAAGLLFAAVTTGQELIDQAKATKLINDVKTVEMRVQQFAQLKGRMPGDCDADGVIDYAADATDRTDLGNSVRAGEYAFSSALPTIPDAGDAVVLETDGCALTGAGATKSTVEISTSTVGISANVWLNDLKLAGMVSDSAPNRNLAKMVTEDFLFVGKVTDSDTASESADDADYNAIVMHNVPQWMAIRMAQSINGQDAVANRSRLRSLTRDTTSTDGTYEDTWQVVDTEAAAMRDAMVTLVYFFDQVPESRATPL